MLQRLLRQAARRPPGGTVTAAALAAAGGPLQSIQGPAGPGPGASWAPAGPGASPPWAPGPSFRYFHGSGSAHQANLGVVAQLKDETAIALPAAGRRSFW